MKCPNCGTEVGNANFCTECGTPMKEGLRNPFIDNTRWDDVEHERFQRPKGHKILAAVVVALAVFWLIGRPLITGTKPKQASTGLSSYAASSSGESSNLTMGQKNALRAAKQYLNALAFSHDGLIHQLEYDGYSTEDATYAADNCGADWNEQAAKCAKSYLDAMSFSRSELVHQLEFDGFTSSQAEYGVAANGY